MNRDDVLLTEEKIWQLRDEYQKRFDALVEELRVMPVHDYLGTGGEAYRAKRKALGCFEQYLWDSAMKELLALLYEPCPHYPKIDGKKVKDLEFRRRECPVCMEEIERMLEE